MTRLKTIGTYAIGAVVMLAIFALPILLLKGVAWASEKLVRPLVGLSLLAFVFDIIIVLPLSAFRRLRPYTGGFILITSFLFAFTTWIFACVTTLELWGGLALFIGLVTAGVGVVVTALLASLFKGVWYAFWTVVILALVTIVSRVAGVTIGASAEH